MNNLYEWEMRDRAGEMLDRGRDWAYDRDDLIDFVLAPVREAFYKSVEDVTFTAIKLNSAEES